MEQKCGWLLANGLMHYYLRSQIDDVRAIVFVQNGIKSLVPDVTNLKMEYFQYFSKHYCHNMLIYKMKIFHG
jgi:hypothetical protein